MSQKFMHKENTLCVYVYFFFAYFFNLNVTPVNNRLSLTFPTMLQCIYVLQRVLVYDIDETLFSAGKTWWNYHF